MVDEKLFLVFLHEHNIVYLINFCNFAAPKSSIREAILENIHIWFEFLRLKKCGIDSSFLTHVVHQKFF